MLGNTVYLRPGLPPEPQPNLKVLCLENTDTPTHTHRPGAVPPPGFHWPTETGPGDGVSLPHLLCDPTALQAAALRRNGNQTVQLPQAELKISTFTVVTAVATPNLDRVHICLSVSVVFNEILVSSSACQSVSDILHLPAVQQQQTVAP